MNKRFFIFILICAVILGGGAVLVMAEAGVGGATILNSVEYEEYLNFRNRYSKMDLLLNYIESDYYKEVDENALFESAYKGLFQGLDDPYSEYVEASNSEEYFNEVGFEYTGIGMVYFMNDDGDPEVDSVYLESPAARAEIRPGDILLKAGDITVHGMDSIDIRSLIRGPEGTEVTLLFKRGDSERTVTVKREKLSEITVAGAMDEENNLAYIQISGFGNSTAQEFEKELEKLEESSPKGLIIDLRYNGGGLVDSAVEIADILMNKGTVAYAQDRNGNKLTYKTEDGRIGIPYVILVNGSTASASEILTIGVQENKEGLVVGTQTFGKGIIQRVGDIGDGSIAKITVCEYFSPSGETIHKVGITPDYVVDLPLDAQSDLQYEKAVELLK